MANEFTTNYSLVKSEVGGDNQNWGTNLRNSLDTIDGQLINKLDKDVVKGFTSSAVVFTNTGSSAGTISASSGDLFQDFEVGDKVRVTGASEATNGSDASPSIHTITTKTSSNSITVSTGLVSDSGDSVTVTLVFEQGYSDIGAGEIDGTPIGANSASSGAFTTVSATGQITSTVADGTPPLVVTSTTKVTNLNADTLDGQTAPSGTIVGTTDTQALTNKTLNSSTNTIHADQWRTSRTLTLSGDCTGSATIDGSGNVTLSTTVGGLVKFKSTGKSGGNPASGKTWIAFGNARDAEAYATATVSGSAQSTYARGYGFGDLVSINTGSGFVDNIPSGVSANWMYTLEFDDA